METKVAHDVKAVGEAFRIGGLFVEAAPYGSGHINDTYAAVYQDAGRRVRYIHQRINHNVFKDPVALMENIRRVTEHQRRRLAAAGETDLERRALTLIAARDGQAWHRDDEGNVWRTYLFIEGARTHDVIQDERQAFLAARAFGAFQGQLADLPGTRLTETIPNFHHTPARFAVLEAAIAADVRNRAASCRAEIDFCLRQKPWVGRLVEAQRAGAIPERVTHNDTKLNNVMIDDTTGEGICVIDLDTVMPGLALYDFGDMVRTSTSPAKEDERDLSQVTMRMPYFEALARGYLSSAGGFLNPAEKALMAFSGKLITFEIGVRFLTDHLQGDVYFKIHRPAHNLDRCRTQFRLAESIAQQEDAMEKLVAGIRFLSRRRGDAEQGMKENDVSGAIVDAAVRIPQSLGPGLLESVYEAVLAAELARRGLAVQRQVPVRISFEGLQFDEGFRADLIVNEMVVVELKSVQALTDAHKKQLLTYVKLSGCRIGLLLNFGEALIKNGIVRIVNRMEDETGRLRVSAPPREE